MTAEKQRTYFVIDMKSFFASAECAARGLDPFETPLVVADPARGRGALCLAVTPKMKALGVRNRCRLFEIPDSIRYIIAPPRMQYYIDTAADIYDIYLDYIAPEDIHVYSIDESFLDVTDYLRLYKTKAREFATFLIGRIGEKLHIPATAGIGTNMYLAKIALDITAKHAADGIGILDEESYRETLWDHEPLTDFWQISRGTTARLSRYGIYTMRGIAGASPELLYRLFGVNAELLIDHAYGREPCTIADVKAYRSRSHSISNSQILMRDYSFSEARTVLSEMVLNACQEMMRRHKIAGTASLYVGYSDDDAPYTWKAVRMKEATQVYSTVNKYFLSLYDETTLRDRSIRRLGISLGDVRNESYETYDLFTDIAALEREKKIEHTVLDIKDKFGKNSMLRAIDLQEEATAMERNRQIGGHKA